MQKIEKGKFEKFFISPLGRRIVFYAAGTTTCALFFVNFVPQTFGLSYLREFMACYRNGTERPIPQKLSDRVEKALNTLNVPDYQRHLIKPFSVFGFDLFQAGTTNYRFGGLLGIPANYSYANSFEINRDDIRFYDKAIDWDSESGKYLEQAIILTEEEQIFGICRSILQLQTHRVLLNSIFPSISFFSVYAVGSYLNLKLNLYARPFSLRLVLYGILGVFGIGSWSFMKDFNQVSYDADIDKKLSSLGPEFVAAGIGFYDKMLKKNIAIRELLGNETYTAKGNENYFLRQKSLPLTLRKTFFEEKWKELHEQLPQTAPGEMPQ